MAVQDDYQTILKNTLSTCTGSDTPYDSTRKYIETQIASYNLTGRDAAQLMTQLMGNMTVAITQSAIAVALSVSLGQSQDDLTKAQIITETSKQESIAADIDYKNTQKNSLNQTVEDNRIIKSLDAISNLTLGVASGGLTPTTKMLTAFFQLVNSLNSTSISESEADYTLTATSTTG